MKGLSNLAQCMELSCRGTSGVDWSRDVLSSGEVIQTLKYEVET